MSFSIYAFRSEMTCLIRLSGELDEENIRRTSDVIYGCLSPRMSAVVLDMSELTYLGSSGIKLLFELALQLGFYKVGIWGVNDNVYRIMEIANIADKLSFISRPVDINDWEMIDQRAA